MIAPDLRLAADGCQKRSQQFSVTGFEFDVRGNNDREMQTLRPKDVRSRSTPGLEVEGLTSEFCALVPKGRTFRSTCTPG